MPTFDLAEAMVEFAAGSEANWNNFTLPIPSNVVIFTTDSKKFKRGDGVHRFSELQEGPSIEGIASGEETVVNVLTTLLPTDNDAIVVIDSEIYKPSTTKLNDIIGRIFAIANKDAIQDANIATAVSQSSLINSATTAADDGKLAVISNHKMSAGALITGLSPVITTSPIYIRSFGIFSDKACTIPADTFDYSSTYYAKVHGMHNAADVDSLTFTLTEESDWVDTVHLGRGLFKINVARPPTGGPLVMTATVTYNADTVSSSKTVTLNAYVPIFAAVYGGSASDVFYSVTTDSSNNIICVGSTASEGAGGDALVVKFDSSLNVVARKRYGGSSSDQFQAVVTDGSGNIICVGSTASEGAGGDALIIKFDSSLAILARKRYGAAGIDNFQAVTVDSQDNIICAGQQLSGVGGGDAMVIKFDSQLNKLAGKRYGGSAADIFQGVATDSADNIICAGYTLSEGAGNYDALVIKFDSSLNILAKKCYGGVSLEYFNAVTTDSSDNIICAGYTTSEGAGGDALVVKFDSSLNIVAKKRYGGSGSDQFQAVTTDSSGNIVCVGYDSEGTNGDALVVKFDSSLNIVAKKRYGGISNDTFYGVATDSSGNIICAGNTSSEGAGGTDALVLKLLATIPAGTFTGTVLTGLTLADSNLTLADSVLTLANSNLALADSALTLANSTLTLADSILAYETDTLN